MKVLLGHRASDGEGEPRDRGRRAGRINRRRLYDLAKAYDDELEEPVLAEGLRREAREMELLDTAGKAPELGASPEWEQLVYAALAEAAERCRPERRRRF